MTNSKQSHAMCGLVLLTLQATVAVGADETGAPAEEELETVVVTAEKRPERFQDVAAAATVINDAQLRDQLLTDVGRLSAAVPAFEAHPGNGGYLTIRGIGTKSWARSAQGDVVTILDGIPLNYGANPGTLSSLFDVQQVEVLEGPQSTLFGASAIAGAINIVTRAPDPSRYEFKAHTDVDDRDGAIVQALANIPLGQDAALRITAHRDWAPNVVYNDYRGQWDSGTTTGVRARFLWQPKDALTVNVIADFARDRHDNEALVVQSDPIVPNPLFNYRLDSALAACGVTPSKDNYRFCMDGQGNYGYRDYGVSGYLDYKLDNGITLSALTSDRTNEYITQFDFDNTQYNIANVDGGADYRKVFSQELRITSPSGGRLEYVGGLYFLNQRMHSTLTQAGNFNYCFYVGGVCYALPANYYGQYEVGHNSSHTYAGFVQATYHLSSDLALIGGLRYTHDTIDSAVTRSLPPISVAFSNGTPGTYGASSGHSDVSGKVGAKYNFKPDWMAYVTASKGYKAPAINEPTSSSVASLVVKPETLYNYEIGTKAGFLDKRLWLTASLYYEDMKDWQVSTFDQTTRTFYFSNARSLSTRGVDLSVFGDLTSSLYLSAAINRNLGTFGSGTILPCGPTEYAGDGHGCVNLGGGATGVDIGGRRFAGSPEWKFVGSGGYHHGLGFGGVEGFAQADVTYTDAVSYSIVYDPGASTPVSWLLNARLGIRSGDGRWSVSIFSRNLLDQRIATAVWDTTIGGYLQSPGSHSSSLGYDSFRRIGISVDLSY